MLHARYYLTRLSLAKHSLHHRLPLLKVMGCNLIM